MAWKLFNTRDWIWIREQMPAHQCRPIYCLMGPNASLDSGVTNRLAALVYRGLSIVQITGRSPMDPY